MKKVNFDLKFKKIDSDPFNKNVSQILADESSILDEFINPVDKQIAAIFKISSIGDLNKEVNESSSNTEEDDDDDDEDDDKSILDKDKEQISFNQNHDHEITNSYSHSKKK